jgi:hypothetical protein
MSQYTTKLDDGSEILYGLDKPTGGYFWVEFQYSDGEEEPVGEGRALTLSGLLSCLELYGIKPDIKKLINDFEKEEEPTSLQIRVSKLFGEPNPIEKLHRVLRDLVLNHEYKVKE